MRLVEVGILLLTVMMGPSLAFLGPQHHHEPFSATLFCSNYIPPPNKRPPPQGGDMAYIKENVQRQKNTYTDIRKVGGVECVNDVYVRDPNRNLYWFVGKVARCTGTLSLEDAISRQWNLIEEHATRLRPVELGRCFGRIAVYTAPGDTELLVEANDDSIPFTKIEKRPAASSVPLLEVGFDAQVVTNRGVGFFVEREEPE